MQTYLMYDTTTGAVRGRCGNVPFEAYASLPPGTALLPVEPGHVAAIEYDYTQFYVAAGVIHRREPPNITLSAASFEANGLEEVRVTGIPEGARLTVSGAVNADPFEVTGGVITLTSTQEGEIRLRLDCPIPHAVWEGVIHAT